MSLYEEWIRAAYDKGGASNRKFWDEYMPREQKVYEKMLAEKNPLISGTVAEIAKQSGLPEVWAVGFLEGVKESLDDEIDTESLASDTVVNTRVDFERLYKKMVQFKAEHLYNLPEWDGLFDAERRKEMFREQKDSGTTRREEPKVGRNDPCPCGSGKKYKKCCGA